MKKRRILFAVLLMMLALLCVGCGEKKKSEGSAVASPATATAPAKPTQAPVIHDSGEYLYYLLPDGTAEITRYTGNAAELSVPDTLDGHSVTSIGDRAFIGCDSLTSIMLPEGLTSIGYDAFYSCDSLTSITLPEGLTSIGDNAFSGCTALTGITLPDSVTEMGINPFSGCDKLTDIRVSPDQPMFATIDGVLLNKAEKKLVCYPAGLSATKYQVPKGILSIGDWAFDDCTRLTSITLPEGLTSIGDNAFSDCISLTGITLPEGLTNIGDWAFYGCRRLSSITLPEGLTSIGDRAFNSCTRLTSITLPEGLTSIGDRAFDGCPEDMQFTVVQDSWAESWCRENGKNYTFPDVQDWLNN